MPSRYPTPRSAALLLALVVTSAFAAESRYEVLNLRTVGFSDAYAVNNHGHVVGGAPNGARFVWNGTSVAQIQMPEYHSVVTGLNDEGTIIGFRPFPFSNDRGFVIANGTFAEFEPTRIPTALNNSGQIAMSIGNPSRPVIYHAGALTEIGSLGRSTILSAINTAGWVVGSAPITEDVDPKRAVLFRNGALNVLGTLGGNHSWASDINDAGNILGGARDEAGNSHVTLYTAGKMLPIGSYDPQGEHVTLKINNYNLAIGHFATGAHLWSGGVLKPLAELVDLAGRGFDIVELVDFNDRGQILLRGWNRALDTQSDPLLLTPRPGLSARLTALAARAAAGANDQTSIAGFVLAGNSSGSVLLRTVGPGLLPLGVSNAASDPTLRIFNSANTIVATNDNWSADSAEAATLAPTAARLGAQPLAAGSNDAALLADLPPGAYTAHASNSTDSSRIVLTEIYDAGDENDARLSAASIRLQIGTGESIGIVGFALAGEGPAKVLLRALGPDLASRGVTGALADPQLWLYRGSTPVMGNDDWGSAATTPLLASTTTQVGLPALADASKDAALLIQLEPGAYSLHVSGANNSTGVALVEVYLVP